MGYITKTITESVGEESVMTSYYFETYEDFAKFENGQDVMVEESAKTNLEADEDDGWINNPGYLPEKAKGRVVDVKYANGLTLRGYLADSFRWWNDHARDFRITHYKIVN